MNKRRAVVIFDRAAKIVTVKVDDSAESNLVEDNGQKCSFEKGTCSAHALTTIDLDKGKIALDSKIEDADANAKSSEDLYFTSDFHRDGAKVVGTYDVFVGDGTNDQTYKGQSTSGPADYAFDIQTTNGHSCVRRPKATP